VKAGGNPFQCWACGKSASEGWTIDIHHINKNPEDNNLWNLEALCTWCHSAEHPDLPIKLFDEREFKESQIVFGRY